jgi:hypothetical protein
MERRIKGDAIRWSMSVKIHASASTTTSGWSSASTDLTGGSVAWTGSGGSWASIGRGDPDLDGCGFGGRIAVRLAIAGRDSLGRASRQRRARSMPAAACSGGQWRAGLEAGRLLSPPPRFWRSRMRRPPPPSAECVPLESAAFARRTPREAAGRTLASRHRSSLDSGPRRVRPVRPPGMCYFPPSQKVT